MSESSPNRRWFRFSLRTLLLVVAVAAALSWAYWIGWPWWQAHREQQQFETAVRQLRIVDGESIDLERLPLQQSDTTQSTRDKNLSYSIGKYVRRNFSYCIICSLLPPEAGKFEYLKISAYRLQHAPLDYRPYRDRDLSIYNGSSSSAWIREIEYIDDFAHFILGDPEDGRPFQYELIYSDPPSEPIK